MFKAVMQDAKILRDSVDMISQIIDEGIFKFKKNGIEMLTPDRAMVAVIDFKLSNEAFEEYETDKDYSVGLNMDNFLTVLKRASGKIQLDLEEDKLNITIFGSSVRKFTLPLLQISEDVPPLDQLDFKSSLDLKTSVIDDGIADADIMADSVIMETNDSVLTMKASGSTSKTELKIEKGENLLDISGKAKARYPLDYLKKFMKAGKIVDKAKIQFGDDYPMKIELKGTNVYFTMILAPRVSEE